MADVEGKFQLASTLDIDSSFADFTPFFLITGFRSLDHILPRICLGFVENSYTLFFAVNVVRNSHVCFQCGSVRASA
jgi:hypothetical protein